MKVSKVTGYLLCGMILAAGILFFVENDALAEDVTITTYYPAPYGVYGELEVDKNLDGNTATVTGLLIDIDESGTNSGTVTGLKVDVSGIASGTCYAATFQGANVGIGTASPNYQLELSLDSAAKPTSNAWTVVSDRRLKKDIEPFTDGLDIIAKINPVRYRLNGKAGTPKDQKGISVIAQDIKDIAPYTIKTYKAKLEPTDKEETELFTFDSSPFTFVMINAIKEQQKQIDNLKLKVEELKVQLSAQR